MLPLELRQEFRTAHMRGTAIELRNKQNTGWAQRDPAELLRITYPTADVQRALEAVSKSYAGRPIVLKGQRGRGKSHIMALLHHAFKSPDLVQRWSTEWADRLAGARAGRQATRRTEIAARLPALDGSIFRSGVFASLGRDLRHASEGTVLPGQV